MIGTSQVNQVRPLPEPPGPRRDGSSSESCEVESRAVEELLSLVDRVSGLLLARRAFSSLD